MLVISARRGDTNGATEQRSKREKTWRKFRIPTFSAIQPKDTRLAGSGDSVETICFAKVRFVPNQMDLAKEVLHTQACFGTRMKEVTKRVTAAEMKGVDSESPNGTHEKGKLLLSAQCFMHGFHLFSVSDETTSRRARDPPPSVGQLEQICTMARKNPATSCLDSIVVPLRIERRSRCLIV